MFDNIRADINRFNEFENKSIRSEKNSRSRVPSGMRANAPVLVGDVYSVVIKEFDKLHYSYVGKIATDGGQFVVFVYEFDNELLIGESYPCKIIRIGRNNRYAYAEFFSELCGICHEKIPLEEIAHCPLCGTAFHWHHLAEWFKDHEICPYCQQILKK